jgi:hypothetical protein
MMARRLGTKEELLEPYGEEWLGGEAHLSLADPRSPFLRLLQGLRASRAFHVGFGFASGLVIGTGLAILLTRRRRS